MCVHIPVKVHAHSQRSGVLIYLTLLYSFETGPFTEPGSRLVAKHLQLLSCPSPTPRMYR